MKKYITDFKVVSCENLTKRMFLMELTPADGSIMGECLAGQFVEVRVDGEPQAFLRRAISIHRVDRKRNVLKLLIQRAGAGTERLAKTRVGEIVNIIYPLGNGFSFLPEAKRYLLVGGGVGIAPLLEMGCRLREMGCEVCYLLGVRSSADLPLALRLPFEESGRLLVTTEDGSEGVKGFVTQHPELIEGRFDAIRVCGPGPMMKAVASLVSQWQQNERSGFCEVSLENKMACGIGVCLCCVEDTKEGHKCVCSEGPVFDIKDLKW